MARNLASCSAFNQNATFCSILILYHKYRQSVKKQYLWFLCYILSRNSPQNTFHKSSAALYGSFSLPLGLKLSVTGRDILPLVERGVLARNPEGGRSMSYTLAKIS